MEEEKKTKKPKKEFRVRIVNKTKDKITLSYGKGKTEDYTWDEFKSAYTIKDGIWAILREELAQKRDELEVMINDAVAYYLMSQAEDPSKKLDMMLLMGNRITAIQEALGCSMLDAITLVRQRIDLLKNGNLGTRRKKGDKPRKKRSPEYKDYNPSSNASKRNASKQESMPTATFELGDLPGFAALQEKFKK